MSLTLPCVLSPLGPQCGLVSNAFAFDACNSISWFHVQGGQNAKPFIKGKGLSLAGNVLQEVILSWIVEILVEQWTRKYLTCQFIRAWWNRKRRSYSGFIQRFTCLFVCLNPRSTWRLHVSSSQTLRRTVLWTMCACSWTWLTILREN